MLTPHVHRERDIRPFGSSRPPETRRAWAKGGASRFRPGYSADDLAVKGILELTRFVTNSNPWTGSYWSPVQTKPRLLTGSRVLHKAGGPPPEPT
jgi:hypothetical protein